MNNLKIDSMLDHIHKLTRERDAALDSLAELNSSIAWETTCLNCASLMDENYQEYMRAEKAEDEIKNLRAELAALKEQS